MLYNIFIELFISIIQYWTEITVRSIMAVWHPEITPIHSLHLKCIWMTLYFPYAPRCLISSLTVSVFNVPFCLNIFKSSSHVKLMQLFIPLECLKVSFFSSTSVSFYKYILFSHFSLHTFPVYSIQLSLRHLKSILHLYCLPLRFSQKQR